MVAVNVLLVAVAAAEAVNLVVPVSVEVEALEFLVVAAGVVLSEIKYERSFGVGVILCLSMSAALDGEGLRSLFNLI